MDTIKRSRMEIPWEDSLSPDDDLPITDASLEEKAGIIGRIGLMLLSCGTGAWRVRTSMNSIASLLDVSCSVDIGLMSLNYDCFDRTSCVSQSLTLGNTGVNTAKLTALERFVNDFEEKGVRMTGAELHRELEQINRINGLYSPLILGLASALACGGFTFLLGGGIWEMLLAFLGAGVGNAVRSLLIRRHYTLFLNVSVSVACACITYAFFFRIFSIFGLNPAHEAGYICAMLFIIPGFPFITSGIDISKLDFRSGIERLTYALTIILVATVSAWILALILGLQPMDFLPLGLSPLSLLLFRLIASFAGVFGFSIMFNSPVPLATKAAVIGAFANTLRLELVDLHLSFLPPAFAAFLGAMTAGLLASLMKKKMGYPRISITVPSIVIMVPGLYLYKGIYHLGSMALSESASWLASAALIVISLPMGLIAARILTDRSFRYSA